MNRAVAAWIVLLLMAIALSCLAGAQNRLPGDLWLARSIQDLPGFVEGPAELMRWLTETWFVVVLGTVAVTAFDFTARRRAWLVFTIMLIVLPLLQASLKNVVDRPRPDAELIERRATFTSESFPAGHVLGGTALILLIAWLVSQRLPPGGARTAAWAVAAALCLFGGIANVYEGVHWPSDVLGGYLWAGVLMGGALLLARRRSKENPAALQPDERKLAT